MACATATLGPTLTARASLAGTATLHCAVVLMTTINCGATTRQDVAQKLTVGLKARLDGVPLPSEQLKVGRYLQEWLQSARPSVRPSTWRRYEQLLRVYALPTLGTLALTRLEPRHVQRLYADCLEQGLAPATVRQLHAVDRKSVV